MGLFNDKAEFEDVLGALVESLVQDPSVGPKLARSKLIVRLEFTDPDTQITMNFKDTLPAGQNYVWGDTPWEPDVAFRQPAEFSNRFWQGKVNVLVALAKRQVSARGNIAKALALVPAIQPAFRIYPQVLRRLGKSHLIVA